MRENQCILHKHVLFISRTRLYRILGGPEDSSHIKPSVKFSKCACNQDGTWSLTGNWKCETKCHIVGLYIFVYPV